MFVSLVLAGAQILRPAPEVLSHWTLVSEGGCSLVKSTSVGGKTLEVSLILAPLSDEVMLRLRDSAAVGAGFAVGDDADVWLDPSQERIKGKWTAFGTDTGSVVIISVQRTAVSRLARATVANLMVRNGLVASIPMTDVSAALPQLNDCSALLLKQYGLDPAEDAALAQGALAPVPVGGSAATGVIKAEDYPKDAVRRHEQGKVSMVLTLNSEGWVSDCRVVVSSKSTSLDQASCDIMKQRVRYALSPAPDKHHVVKTVHWVLPNR